MKFISKPLALLGLISAFGCNSIDDNAGTIDVPITPVILSGEIEVYNPDITHNNLVLAVENGGTSSYLINKKGERLFTWNFDTNLGNDLELLPDGSVIGIFKAENPGIVFGGYGGVIKIISPDNSIQWEFEYNSSNYIAHHDVELLPNGNILILVWEKIDVATAQQAGVDVTHDIYPEKLVEVDTDTDEIVWEWRSWDHIVQDIDSNLPNFASVSDNPHLININYAVADNGDIMHANGIDYDSTKDVIYMSVNAYSEIWVVDHSTNTEEAASNNGGAFGKGGDLLYRFGNPTTYNNTVGLRMFFNNHFPNLIEGERQGNGNILVFVNGINTNQSSVLELEMPESFSLTPDADNEPNIAWRFTDNNLFSSKFSGATRLSNGNTLICEGTYGFWEVTPSGEVAWKYNGVGNFWRGYDYDLDDTALSNVGLTF